MNKDLEHNMDSCLAGDCDSCTEEFEMNTDGILICAEKLRTDIAEHIGKIEAINSLYAARQYRIDTELEPERCEHINKRKQEEFFSNMLKKKADAVDHPAHYKRDIECIDEMIEVFGIGMVRNFCLLNVWKYRYRATDKNGKEDIEKSDWYMKKYLELKQ